MKPEHLDALLLDRAVGELSPAAAELLTEHLARDPSAAHRAREIEATTGLARSAVAAGPVEKLPPLKALAMLPGGSRWQGEWLRLAAAVAFGLLSGTGIGLKLSAPVPGALSGTAIVAAAPIGEPAAATSFWSASRRTAELLRLADRASLGATGHGLRWHPARLSIPAEDKP